MCEAENYEEMTKFDTEYSNLLEKFKSIKYLDCLSETFIFETYKETLLIDNEISFPEDVSQVNRDMFYRLKFRALNNSRVKFTDSLDLKC
jgi:hypothetical protein